jgi:ribose transport system substrate-binding protein
MRTATSMRGIITDLALSSYVRIFAFLLLLTSCHRDQKRTIAVIPKATTHLFFVSVHAGVLAAEREFGVNIVWNGPDQETDSSRQIEITDAMVARHVDAIAISATDRDALVAPVRRAMNAGIPVTVFDSGLAIDDYVTFVATDNYDAGRTAAHKIAALLNDKGKIAVIMQRPGGQSTTERERGFQEAIAKDHPGIRIVAQQYGMGDPAKSRAAAEDILTANPDLDGIFASAEASSIGSIQALTSRKLAGKIRLVGFDFSEHHKDALEQGMMDATVVQDPYRMGYEAVHSLVLKLKGETPAKRMDLKARLILKGDLTNPDLRKILFPSL